MQGNNVFLWTILLLSESNSELSGPNDEVTWKAELCRVYWNKICLNSTKFIRYKDIQRISGHSYWTRTETWSSGKCTEKGRWLIESFGQRSTKTFSRSTKKLITPISEIHNSSIMRFAIDLECNRNYGCVTVSRPRPSASVSFAIVFSATHVSAENAYARVLNF